MAKGALLLLLESDISDLVSLAKEFGTGWKGFLFLWSVLVAWILHGYLPKRYEAKMDFKKFVLEHEDKAKKLRQRASSRKKKEEESHDGA